MSATDTQNEPGACDARLRAPYDPTTHISVARAAGST